MAAQKYIIPLDIFDSMRSGIAVFKAIAKRKDDTDLAKKGGQITSHGRIEAGHRARGAWLLR